MLSKNSSNAEHEMIWEKQQEHSCLLQYLKLAGKC